VPKSKQEKSQLLANDLRVALMRLIRQIKRESFDAEQSTSTLQTLLLVSVHEQPGIGVGELAAREKLRGPTISGHIKQMEAADLLRRTASDPLDRRRVGLYLTDHGKATLEEMRQRRLDWLARELAALTDAERSAIQNAIGPLSRIGNINEKPE
jgi:DNA-binding MarR family transcriptional regulator